MKKLWLALGCLLTLNFSSTLAQQARPPVMGWSSWNNFRIHINEKLIREQADAMISSGLYDAGYRFINIDDGYFEGRDSLGNLVCDSAKFPGGMKALADYIHSKNLKAGIYSDAGRNTCGSIWDNDKKGIGVGMYAHLEQDCETFFKKWGYDFLKVDWCGGEKMQLDEKTEYLKIIRYIRSMQPGVVFNVCRWQFPGEWAIKEADSWRISGDIRAEFSSILHIIDLNANLYRYASPGHYNDMDMLQVGRGMSYEEDKTHFSMWCMLNSPLLAGNDLRSMTAQTLEILTNKEVIAINQDPGFEQAQRIAVSGSTEIWRKSLGKERQDGYALAIMNRGDAPVEFDLSPEHYGLTPRQLIRDLWQHKDLGKIGKKRSFKIPAHGVVMLKVSKS